MVLLRLWTPTCQWKPLAQTRMHVRLVRHRRIGVAIASAAAAIRLCTRVLDHVVEALQPCARRARRANSGYCSVGSHTESVTPLGYESGSEFVASLWISSQLPQVERDQSRHSGSRADPGERIAYVEFV